MNKKVHFMGIGGSGASAVAMIAKGYGFAVSGCGLDIDNEFTEGFEKESLEKGHSVEHIKNIDILALTPAIYSLDPDNEELQAAKKQGVEILTWQQFMGKYLEKDKFVIAVCGTHGKSTVTAMTGSLLADANLDPTVELGAVYSAWGKNYLVGSSKYFVTEADEFNDNFLGTHSDITILTNIEFDHPEFFANFEDYKQSFLEFLYQTKSLVVANLADPGVREVMEVFQKNKEKRFDPKIIDYSKSSVEFPLKVVGGFNKLNATAVYQVGLHLNIDPEIIRKSLMGFIGIGRRAEFIGDFKGAKIFSDFAHHPTEIRLTVAAFREKYHQSRIVLIYEPHMFSRTKALMSEFVQTFKEIDADQIFILDIYPSREVDTGIISSKELVEAIGKRTVSYLGPKEEVENFIKVVIRKDDVVIFMGAGEVDGLARKIALPD